MGKSGRSAGSSDGFTLLEVVVAAAILAGSVGAIVAVYVRCTERAAAARDLTIAAATARNALAEGIAEAIETEVEGEIPERDTLWLTYSEWPSTDDELPFTDNLFADVTRGGAPVTSFVTRRALYITELEEEGVGADEGEEGGDE